MGRIQNQRNQYVHCRQVSTCKSCSVVSIIMVEVLSFSRDFHLVVLTLLTLLIISSLQIGFFPKERAFSLRYQTAGMLDTTLRQGVLGEDDTGEESPRFGLLHSLLNIA